MGIPLRSINSNNHCATLDLSSTNGKGWIMKWLAASGVVSFLLAFFGLFSFLFARVGLHIMLLQMGKERRPGAETGMVFAGRNIRLA